MFWRSMPDIWRDTNDSANTELVAHKDIGFDEDDNGTAFVGMHDKDRDLIFIMFYYNF